MAKYFLSLILFSAFLSSDVLRAEDKNCTDMLAKPAAASAEQQQEEYTERLRKNGQQTWVAIDRWARQRLKGYKNPFENSNTDADGIGLVHAKLAQHFPSYYDYYQEQQKGSLDHNKYIQLRQKARQELLTALRDPNSSAEKLFAALEVNRVMSDIHARVDFPVTEKASEEDKNEGSESEDEKEQEEQEEVDNPPSWDELPDNYDPNNTDLSNEDGQKEKKYDLLKTNMEVYKKLLRVRVYDVLNGSKWGAAPLSRPTTAGRSGKQVGYSELLVAGASRIQMPIQYGFEPIVGKYNGFEVNEYYPEEFEVIIKVKNLDKIQVPLREAAKRSFKNGNNPDKYKEATGIKASDWPQEFREFISGLKNQNLSVTDVAGILEKYFSDPKGDFLYYSVGDKVDQAALAQKDQEIQKLLKQYPKAVAYFRAGIFNCDGAALIATTVLRDFFNVPVRPVGGVTIGGYRMEGNEKIFVHQSGDPKHAWVEVWDGSRWVPFDMTPQANNPSSNSSSDSDLLQEEDQQSSDDVQDSPSESQTSESEGGEADQSQESSGEESDGESSDAEAKDGESSEGEGSESSESEGSDSDDADSEQELNEGENLSDRLRGRGKSGGKNHSNIQMPDDVLYHSLAQHGIENLIKGGGGRKDLLAWLYSLYQGSKNDIYGSDSIKSAEARVRRAYQTYVKDLDEETPSQILTNIQRLALSGDLTTAYSATRSLVEIIEEIEEHRKLSKEEVKFIGDLQSMLSSMADLNHDDAKLFDMAYRLFSSLPGNISKEWLAERFGQDLLRLGHPSLHNFAKAIVSQELKQMARAGVLKDYAKLILNSEKVPNFRDQKTSMRTPVTLKRKDFVIARSPLEISYFLFNLKPGENMFNPLVEGRQFALGQRDVRRIPDPVNPIERKLSVVYYDISGSMNGLPLETVDSLLLAFVDIALSEVDPFGRPTHEVIVVPFDDSLRAPIFVKSKEDALEFIANKTAKSSKAQGGTDIEKAILDFYSLVSSAYDESSGEEDIRRLLKRANLVLFTDGGSHIDYNKVAQARKAVPESVQLYMNLIGLGNQENETLIQLANESNKQEAEAMYRQITDDFMNEADEAAKITEDPEAFASDQRAPSEMINGLSQIMRQIPNFENEIDEAKLFADLQKLDFDEHAADKLKNPAFVTNINGLSKELVRQEWPRKLKLRFLARLIQEYPRLSGRQLNRLTLIEMRSLKALADWAQR